MTSCVILRLYLLWTRANKLTYHLFSLTGSPYDLSQRQHFYKEVL